MKVIKPTNLSQVDQPHKDQAYFIDLLGRFTGFTLQVKQDNTEISRGQRSQQYPDQPLHQIFHRNDGQQQR
jgi:hypothetical protein